MTVALACSRSAGASWPPVWTDERDDEIAAQVEALVGAPLASSTAASLREISGGDPAVALDLARSARRTGALRTRHGLASIEGRWPISSALSARVESDLRALSP